MFLNARAIRAGMTSLSPWYASLFWFLIAGCCFRAVGVWWKAEKERQGLRDEAEGQESGEAKCHIEGWREELPLVAAIIPWTFCFPKASVLLQNC